MARLELGLDAEYSARALGGDSASLDAAGKINQEATKQYEQAMTELLGLEGVSALRDYKRTIPLRANIAPVVARLAELGVPLSNDQAEGLIDVAVQTSGEFRRGRVATFESVDWNAALERACVSLSSEQAATLAKIVQRMRTEKELASAIAAATKR